MTPTDALIEDAGELGASRAGILQDARMTRPDAATEALAPTSLAAVRAAVEGDAAGYAASRRSPAQEQRIVETYEELRALTRAGTPSSEADFRFHLAIAEAANNPRFSEFLRLIGPTIIPRRVFSPDDGAPLPAEFLRLLDSEHTAIVTPLAKLAPLGFKEFEVFDLPYIFDNMEMLHRVTDGGIGVSLLARLEPKGIKGLAFWDNGFKSFSANHPLHKPSDFKGLKIRIQPSKVLESQIRTLGALPQNMAFSDIYQALRTGIIDGAENPHSNFYTQKMYEVQKHITLTDHGYLGYAVITNRRFWDKLPSGIRYQLAQAIKEATVYANRIAQEENDTALKRIVETGKTRVYTPTESERAEFKKLMLKTHAEMAPRIGKEIIDAIYRETGFDPARM